MLRLQVQRHALVTMTKVLRNAHGYCLSPELQAGRAVAIAASVMQHTFLSGAMDAQQWKAWCCRLLFYASNVDEACSAKVLICRLTRPRIRCLVWLGTLWRWSVRPRRACSSSIAAQSARFSRGRCCARIRVIEC
jgi:hypothetical protein